MSAKRKANSPPFGAPSISSPTKRLRPLHAKSGSTATPNNQYNSPDQDDEAEGATNGISSLPSTAWASQPRTDPATGQRGAFPGLDDGGGHGPEFYGPANDGLEYLRMVR